MDTHQWYALRVRGGREEKVKEALENAFSKKKLEDALGEIILPFEKVFAVKNGKKTAKKRYFAYLFVQLTLSDQVKDTLQDVEGVYGFVGAGSWSMKEEPTPVSQQEIDRMMGKAPETAQVAEVSQERFREGQVVRIVTGPLKGTASTIQKIFSEQRKLVATIRIFGTLTKTELSYEQVEPLA